MAITLNISVAQNSRNVAAMTTNVTVTLTAAWNGGSRMDESSGWLMAAGALHSFSAAVNPSGTDSGTVVLKTVTLDVQHTPGGTKTLVCTAGYGTGADAVTAEAAVDLEPIRRLSTLTVPDGTFGQQQTMTIAPADEGFLHRVTVALGSGLTYQVHGAGTTAATRLTWTPETELLDYFAAAVTRAELPFTLETYSADGTLLGSNTTTAWYDIPQSVRPECTVTVGYSTAFRTGVSGVDYGAPVQGLSTLDVGVEAQQSFGARITRCTVTANGTAYAVSVANGRTAMVETDVIRTAGAQTVTATVTDARGRESLAASAEVPDALAYAPPLVTKLSVLRCDANGQAADQGEYIKVSYAAKATDIGGLGLNSVTYTLRFRPAGGQWSEGELPVLGSPYDPAEEFLFDADVNSVYEIELVAEDNHYTTTRKTSCSPGFILLHFNSAGNGIGVGKSAGLQYGLDIGMVTRHAGGLIHPELGAADLDTVLTPNTYVGDAADLTNCPLMGGPVTLLVEGVGSTGTHQRLTGLSLTGAPVYERWHDGVNWGSWYETTPTYTAI